MSLISVEQAQEYVFAEHRDYGIEEVYIAEAAGRILAADISADRDLPPYDRVTMDGIAIRFEDAAAGVRNFAIAGIMAAGDVPVANVAPGHCVEIMTGCALPPVLDTVIRYEDVTIESGVATLNVEPPRRGANIHNAGSDKKRGEVVLRQGVLIGSGAISMLASVGTQKVPVKRLPRVVVLSSGDELVDIHDTPSPQQVRRSNSWVVANVLAGFGGKVHMAHLSDNEAEVLAEVRKLAETYDVLIMSGGVSMGKFDVIPAALKALGFREVFHKVKQRPGKPFWFGTHGHTGAVVFAFPGNPVSSFLCLYRYFVPWLRQVLQLQQKMPLFAALSEDVAFTPDLQYFLPVQMECDADARLCARPLISNGSGDFSVLVNADAFIELPAGKSVFRKGDVYRVWPFNTNMFS